MNPDAFKIARIHAQRIESAMQKLAPYFPISAEKAGQLTTDELALCELYTGRFGKLQDLMGTQLFDLVLDLAGELKSTMTMIDKINKLEQLEVLESVEVWKNLRAIRNHLSHEYPDDPDATAKHLNQVYAMGSVLLQYFQKLEGFYQKALKAL
jgi:hypothetical protein